MGSLNQLAAFLLLISVAHSVKLRQECDIGLQVGCPSETDGRPWVSCSRVACSVTTNKTWFIGILYKRVDCLEEDGKMVKVEYQRQGRLSCSLVPIQTNPELLQAYLSSANSTCESSVPTSGAPASGTSLTPASATSGVPASATSGASTSATSGAPASAASGGPASETSGASASATSGAPASTTASLTTTAAATGPPPKAPSCPVGWTPFGSSCFLVSDESGTYGDGWNFCRERGGVLASVRSQEEQDFVAGLLPGSVWIGLSDGVAEGTFAWADASTSSYTNFHPNEPSGSGGHADEDCVELRSAFGFAWNDEWCGTLNRYLCRMDV
ncbi:brevican core protein-like [Penaeus monodon]|uniref:brevican core protein-like n=1 Tax=Penaeus monodon TaxID=6687 RepID=UPI0018A71961|nr:brevican core protein-like [Penaeus monodon]